MISVFNANTGFSIATAQAIQEWATANLINEGDILNTVQTVYDDMALINDGYPSGKPTSFGQFYSGTLNTLNTQIYDYELIHKPCTDTRPDPDVYYNPAPDGGWEWVKSNIWWESDMQTFDSSGCTAVSTEATNSCIEVGYGELNALHNMGFPDDESKWEWSFGSNGASYFQGGNVNWSGKACYPNDAFVALRDTMPADFNKYKATQAEYIANVDPAKINVAKMDNGCIRVNPINGYRYHSWMGDLAPTDAQTIECIYVCVWFRIVKIDENLPDDRHLYNQVVHVASDVRAADNAFSLCTNLWGVGGLSRYKKIPNDGTWMPVNMICFRYDEAYGNTSDKTTQTTIERIMSVNPPISTKPYPTYVV